MGTPVNSQTITGTLTLDQYAAPVQAITPSGAARNVKVPSSPALGQSIQIINAAATGGYNLLVKDPGGTITLATLTPGQATPQLFPMIGGGNATPKYSVATFSPVSPT